MVFRAPEQPVAIPESALTSLLLARVDAHGDKAAFIDGVTGRTLTHRDWSRSVVNAAAGLVARGLRKGDVAALYSPNLPEYAIAFHAVSLAGGVTTTVSPLYTSGELQSQLLDAQPKYVFTIPALASRVEACRGVAVRDVFVFGENENGAGAFASLCAQAGDAPQIELNPHEDLAALPYSSGTVGIPKGVMLTHRNLVANMLQAALALDVRRSDRLLGVLPLSHIYGLGLINVVLYQGATAVLLPRFDFAQCVEVMRKHGVTYAPVVPPIVRAFAGLPEHPDLPALRVVLSGAAPLDETIANAAAARLGCRVVQGYGLTETSPVTHATRLASDQIVVAGVGPPVPNTEAKIVNVETAMDCEPRQHGEIWVRGPQVMKGYLNHPAATAETIDGDGWLHTGDIGYADESGCFFVVDRLKELIKYKGHQVAPAELEALLVAHPSIADAAVIGMRDDLAGEVPKGFVVLRADASPDEILAYVSERVAPHKRLSSVDFVPQIPRSPAGKILRRLLAQPGPSA
jgi:acyl-CoA synthetase (AMP-forming)/AMP-acid ligase II